MNLFYFILFLSYLKDINNNSYSFILEIYSQSNISPTDTWGIHSSSSLSSLALPPCDICYTPSKWKKKFFEIPDKEKMENIVSCCFNLGSPVNFILYFQSLFYLIFYLLFLSYIFSFSLEVKILIKTSYFNSFRTSTSPSLNLFIVYLQHSAITNINKESYIVVFISSYPHLYRILLLKSRKRKEWWRVEPDKLVNGTGRNIQKCNIL